MIDAALFDWGGTLSDAEWNDELARRANDAALAAIERREIGTEDVMRWFDVNEDLFRLDSMDEIDLAEITRACLGALGCRLTDEELDTYMYAWHDVITEATRLHPESLPLLAELRRRGLKLGLVSNTFSGIRFLSPQLREHGLDNAIDVVVLSADHGKRKPHPEIFRAALDELGAAPDRAVFVGDRLETDIAGAKAVGMATVQASWFRAEEPHEIVADYVARTPLEVVDIIDRCLSATPS